MREIDIFKKHYKYFDKLMTLCHIQDIYICCSEGSASASNDFFKSKLPVYLIVKRKDECDNSGYEKFRIRLTEKLGELIEDSSLFRIIPMEELLTMKLDVTQEIRNSILKNIEQGKALSIKDQGSIEEIHTPSNISKP